MAAVFDFKYLPLGRYTVFCERDNYYCSSNDNDWYPLRSKRGHSINTYTRKYIRVLHIESLEEELYLICQSTGKRYNFTEYKENLHPSRKHYPIKKAPYYTLASTSDVELYKFFVV